MAQWAKALTTKLEDLSSVPGMNMVERENQHLQVVSDLHMHP
ncbi:hypothetical protein LEMLEM_LOCUS7929 [Lemmus lemmus]